MQTFTLKLNTFECINSFMVIVIKYLLLTHIFSRILDFIQYYSNKLNINQKNIHRKKIGCI